MFVRRLRLQDFRSWGVFDLALQPGVTVFSGPNGHGKTNLLEAVQYLSTLSSHRVAHDQPLIRFGAQSAFVSATAINAGRELTVDVTLNAGRANRARIGGSPAERGRDVLGVVQSVMFSPEDLSLVRGDPGGRRRFLDELMTVRRPSLAGVRADYEKVLRQRSALLKSSGEAIRRGSRSSEGASALATLEVWDRYLAAYGAQIIAARLDLVSELAAHVSGAYESISPESHSAGIRYRSSLDEHFPEDLRNVDASGDRGASGDTGGAASPEGIAGRLEEAMGAALERVRDKELARGVCLVGPHRDDLELRLGEHPVKGYASHGESWSFALALRLAALTLLRTDGTDPILMLDDVFAELDRRRRSALAAVAAETEQVLVTAAVDEDVPQELRARRHTVVIEDDGRERISRLAVSPADARDRDNGLDQPGYAGDAGGAGDGGDRDIINRAGNVHEAEYDG